MFTKTKIHELISIGNNLSADDELIVYDNNTQTTNKVSLSSIYNSYNESYLGIYPYYENRGYNSGEFCTYNNELYVCKNTIPAKSWDSSDWMGTAICQELDDIKTNVSVNTTDISTLNSNLTNMYYKSGDTIAGSIPVRGFITTGSNQIILDFNLPKLIPSNATMTLSVANFQYVRLGYGGYLPNIPTLSNVTSVSEKWGVMRIDINNFATGATNNCVVGGEVVITGTFN